MKTFDPFTNCWTRCIRMVLSVFLVDKVKDGLQKVIDLLESGETPPKWCGKAGRAVAASTTPGPNFTRTTVED